MTTVTTGENWLSRPSVSRAVNTKWKVPAGRLVNV